MSKKYKTALCITGLVTFIAAYHYIRIFNSWVEAYEFPPAADGVIGNPAITGKPFNDAYRYMDCASGRLKPLTRTALNACRGLADTADTETRRHDGHHRAPDRPTAPDRDHILHEARR